LQTSGKINTFDKLMSLEKVNPVTFVGHSPEYNWGRVYGGQVVAQGLAAARMTVGPDLNVHSVHAYFIRGGDSSKEIKYEVDLLRDGKSFATRRVIAYQQDEAILNFSASFQLNEESPDVDHQIDLSGIPSPQDLESDNWSEIMERRVVPSSEIPYGHGVWLKVNGKPTNNATNEEGIVFASDDVPFDAAVRLHPLYEGIWDGNGDPPFFGASLDHAVWFHRSSSPFDWHLHLHEGINHINNRGLASGKIYSQRGSHVATVVQEILQRRSR
tara:strand:- start:4205 stop:5017 length:813 start_codon:yes stop_codon:yes gene_type:complete